jgi:hypothetical protein
MSVLLMSRILIPRWMGLFSFTDVLFMWTATRFSEKLFDDLK